MRQPVNQVWHSFTHSFTHSVNNPFTHSVCFSILHSSLYCVGNETVNSRNMALLHGPHSTEKEEVDVRQTITHKASAHMRKLVRFQKCRWAPEPQKRSLWAVLALINSLYVRMPLRMDRKAYSHWKGRIVLALSMPGFGNFRTESREECVPSAWRTVNGAEVEESREERVPRAWRRVNGAEVEACHVPEESDDTRNNSTDHVLFWTPVLPHCHWLSPAKQRTQRTPHGPHVTCLKLSVWI